MVDNGVDICETHRVTTGVRCMIMRGGSSKGAYFLRDDLPADPGERDNLLLRIMGSGDARQIDGMGGAHPLTSKVAIVGTGTNGADIDYLFLQLGVQDNTVSARQNCGNLLAGVGPFAVERGLVDVAADADDVTLAIFMQNTSSLATAEFVVANGMPVYTGGTAISGVPGLASTIRLTFDDIAGSSTGSLLPTGNARDSVAGVDCTLVDNGMPVVVLRADAVGTTGYESCADLEADLNLRNTLENIRFEASQLMNLGDVTTTTVPKLTLVAPPRAGGDISTRTFIPHRCHDAIGVLGAVSVATAALLPGSPASEVLTTSTRATVVLEHPTGTFETSIAVTSDETGITIESAGIVRTARKLMDGTVFARSY